MVTIIKRDGSTENFDSEKIVSVVISAGAGERDARRIAAEIERKAYDGITSYEIRNMILTRLYDINPRLVDNWLGHERKKYKH